jgi:hypothetical protein
MHIAKKTFWTTILLQMVQRSQDIAANNNPERHLVFPVLFTRSSKNLLRSLGLLVMTQCLLGKAKKKTQVLERMAIMVLCGFPTQGHIMGTTCP